MVLPGESDHALFCLSCDSDLIHGVQKSAAGYYIGTWCPRCGPYARESCYFASKEEAERHFFDPDVGRLT